MVSKSDQSQKKGSLQKPRPVRIDDLEVGMMVEDQYGGRVKVAALETPEAAPDYLEIRSRDFGYASTDWEPNELGIGIIGVSSVSNIVRIISDGGDENCV